jgi:hypothetical protein
MAQMKVILRLYRMGKRESYISIRKMIMSQFINISSLTYLNAQLYIAMHDGGSANVA